MRTTPIGIVMLNDEREHIYTQNNSENMRVVRKWAEVIKKRVKNLDDYLPQIICQRLSPA